MVHGKRVKKKDEQMDRIKWILIQINAQARKKMLNSELRKENFDNSFDDKKIGKVIIQ